MGLVLPFVGYIRQFRDGLVLREILVDLGQSFSGFTRYHHRNY